MELQILEKKSEKIIQTHISKVFLTDKYAFKIKKPVNFGFLDFSSLKKRKFYCREELRLNRLLSPNLYLKVLPITERGKVVDWAVMMRQIPQEKIMTKLLKKNLVSRANLEKLSGILASFHKKAEPDKKYGKIELIQFNWQENFDQTKKYIGKTISKSDFDLIKRKTSGFTNWNKNLFQERVRKNKIRRCHGDLHSGNIFINKDKIYIFDCIEFNDRFAMQDMASDIAFLTMDLEFHKKKNLADFFLKNYLEKTGDWEMQKLLPFYQCYRTFVRGKVNSFQNKKREAKKYFKLALTYAESLT